MDIAINRKQYRPLKKRNFIIAFLLVLLITVVSPLVAVAIDGQGGVWSEKLISRGGADSNLVISRGDLSTVLGLGAITTTNQPTNVTMGSTTSAYFWVVASGDPGASNQDFVWSYRN